MFPRTKNQSNKMVFHGPFHSRRVETCSQALSSLCSVFEQANIIRGKCTGRKSLFPASEKSLAIDLFNMSRAIDQTPFYSRVAGFHVRNQKVLFCEHRFACSNKIHSFHFHLFLSCSTADPFK